MSSTFMQINYLGYARLIFLLSSNTDTGRILQILETVFVSRGICFLSTDFARYSVTEDLLVSTGFAN